MPSPRAWIGIALVLAALARAALLVGHEPLAGYANQYDMVRTSSCIGLYPAVPEALRHAATPAAPVPLYTRGDRDATLCYRSTESAIDGAVARLAHHYDADTDGIPLRWFGWAKLGLMALAMLVVAFALHRHPLASLVHGLLCFLVLADPVVTLWFNSFYTEFPALWGLYAAVAGLCALAAGGRGAFALMALVCVGLVALAFSREQFALLGPALAVTAWPWLWRRSPHAAVGAFGIALVASVVAFGLLPRSAGVVESNRVDTYLGVVLPASEDAPRALAALGLPARCATMIGATWYVRHGEDLGKECPEAMKLSSLAFLAVARVEPAAIARSVARVLPATQAISPGYLGVLAGADHAAIEALPGWLRSVLDPIHLALPGIVYAGFILAVLAAAPLALVGAALWARPARGTPGVGFLLPMLLGGIVAYALVTTVFGDGMSEASRHFLAGNLAAWCAWIALAAALPGAIAHAWRTPRADAWRIAAAVAAFAIVLCACIAAVRWARHQPIAAGLIDVPQGRVVPAAQPLELRGWALDPFGIERIEIEAGPLRRTLAPDVPSPDIHRVLPAYPGAEHARYHAVLTPDDLARAGAPNPVTLRVLVKSRAGPVTPVAHRRLEFATP